MCGKTMGANKDPVPRHRGKVRPSSVVDTWKFMVLSHPIVDFVLPGMILTGLYIHIHMNT